MTSLCPRDFQQDFEPYYFEPDVLQTSEMIAVKVVNWRNWLEKMHFADLVKDANSVESFSASQRFLVG